MTYFLLLSITLPIAFPYMYFTTILFFLAPFSFFIFLQLCQLIELEVYYLKTKASYLKSHAGQQFFVFLSALVKKKLWFDAIKFIEASKSVAQEADHQYFNALGFVYYNMKKYDLAQIYYTEALNVKKDYVMALQNLVKVYEVLQDRPRMLSTYQCILRYDPSNRIARQYLEVQE